MNELFLALALCVFSLGFSLFLAPNLDIFGKDDLDRFKRVANTICGLISVLGIVACIILGFFFVGWGCGLRLLLYLVVLFPVSIIGGGRFLPQGIIPCRCCACKKRFWREKQVHFSKEEVLTDWGSIGNNGYGRYICNQCSERDRFLRKQEAEKQKKAAAENLAREIQRWEREDRHIIERFLKNAPRDTSDLRKRICELKVPANEDPREILTLRCSRSGRYLQITTINDILDSGLFLYALHSNDSKKILSADNNKSNYENLFEGKYIDDQNWRYWWSASIYCLSDNQLAIVWDAGYDSL